MDVEKLKKMQAASARLGEARFDTRWKKSERERGTGKEDDAKEDGIHGSDLARLRQNWQAQESSNNRRTACKSWKDERR